MFKITGSMVAVKEAMTIWKQTECLRLLDSK